MRNSRLLTAALMASLVGHPLTSDALPRQSKPYREPPQSPEGRLHKLTKAEKKRHKRQLRNKSIPIGGTNG